MEALPNYLLKANVVFTALFALYYFLLRKEKFLVGNRFLLLSIFAATVAIPLCPDFISETWSNQQVPIPVFPEFYAGDLQLSASQATNFNSYDWAVGFYLLVVLILLVRLLFQLLKVFLVVRNSARQESEGIVYCEPLEKMPPFSVFKYIVVKPDAFEPEQYRHIITHELCHCREFHSVDVLLSEIACILLWMNPLSLIYRKQVKLNLEFLADEHALKSGISPTHYQRNLVSIAVNAPALYLSSPFHSSKIRQRISMMNTGRPSAKRRYKYALVAPLIALLYVAMNSHEVDSTSGDSLMQENSRIFINARTDTVTVTKVAGGKGDQPVFKGIYVLEEKVYTDRELKQALVPSGKLEVVFSGRPMMGFYTPNDKNAIRKWGKRAKNGVLFVEAIKNTSPNQL